MVRIDGFLVYLACRGGKGHGSKHSVAKGEEMFQQGRAQDDFQILEDFKEFQGHACKESVCEWFLSTEQVIPSGRPKSIVYFIDLLNSYCRIKYQITD